MAQPFFMSLVYSPLCNSLLSVNYEVTGATPPPPGSGDFLLLEDPTSNLLLLDGTNLTLL